jgi:hypothetical protein
VSPVPSARNLNAESGSWAASTCAARWSAAACHEDAVADRDRDKGAFRIMCKGAIGEWTEWMTPTSGIGHTRVSHVQF